MIENHVNELKMELSIFYVIIRGVIHRGCIIVTFPITTKVA